MKRFQGIKGIILFSLLIVLVIGYYFYLANKKDTSYKDVSYEVMTPVQEVLSRNMESNYPATPREVVKYFSEISQCFYNEEYTDDELLQLADRIRELYDDQLVANQTEEEYIKLLKADIQDFKDHKRTISSFSLTSTVDVETYELDGYEWAALYCLYSIKEDVILNSNMKFLLRRDGQGHYKIFGWELADNTQGG